MILYTFFKKLKNLYLVKLRTFLSIDSVMDFGEFEIYLPPEHLLPYYKNTHRLYDRFLPFFCQYLNPKDIVIDVGGNIGDTLASMYAANPFLEFICIEPDDYFFRYLEKNTLIIKRHNENSTVTLIKSLIGNSVEKVSLEGCGGTKKAVHTNNSASSVSSVSLDAALKNIDLNNLKLLKIDVDGYDFDVLDSSLGVLKKYSPVVFFETDFDYDFQLEGYKKTLSSIKDIGYENFVIFDNFGEVVLRTSDLLVIDELFEYVRRMNLERSTRTIYYFDILAFVASDLKFIENIITLYKQK